MRGVKEEDEYPELDQEHFEDICKMATEFKEYLIGVHGDDEHHRASTAKDRNDVELGE
jgi:hypothetical protein